MTMQNTSSTSASTSNGFTQTDSYGDVTLNGIIVHLTQEPYAGGTFEDPEYYARGEDDDGTPYEVTWETTAKWDATPNDDRFDESEACDWDVYTVRATAGKP
jgi:hypothetical protein